MNTQLKVGDRVKVISGVLFLGHTPGFFEQNCIVLEIDKSDNTIRLEYCDKHSVWLYLDTLKCEPPTPKWLPIDRDNLPSERVAAMHNNTPLVFTGILYLCDNDGISLEICNGANVHGFTHYIPLTDLINLPIAE